LIDFFLKKVTLKEKTIVFDLFSATAQILARKKINQWKYWVNPPTEKVIWVEEGIKKEEFFFIVNQKQHTMGVVRVSNDDVLYWGQMNDKAKYIHSLIVKEEFSGLKLGTAVIKKIKEEAILDNVEYLRLDCDCTNKKLCKYYIDHGFTKVRVKELPLGKYNLYQQKILD
jgi:ribosomal protein S18 acetylase RimI-like enzyme